MNYKLLALLLVIFVSCEYDDFCSRTGTPRLVISFYDKNNPSDKKSLPLYVWAQGKDSIYQKKILDSILIPLNTTTEKVHYKISYSKEVEDLIFTYKTQDKFLSNSCGFITFFKELQITSKPQKWIDNIQIVNPSVQDEKIAHVKIFH